LLKRVESDLNEWLGADFSENVNVRYDIDAIPAMAERRKKIYENVVQAVREGILSRNEARERLGYEPVQGGDDVYISANLFPLGEPMESAQEQDTSEDDEKYLDDIYGEEDYAEKQTVDIDTRPTDAMVEEAKRGLEWRKEFKRGGTAVGVARANQIVNKERLSERTVTRMYSFFARHEVDKQAEGFGRGEEGYPSAGRIAWALWGGDAGQSWSKRVYAKFKEDKEMGEEDHIYYTMETKQRVTEAVKNGLKEKVKKHNEKHGDKKGKKVTVSMLERVFVRGIGAYRTNPQSVRPSVNSEEQWAYARVNAFLVAVRTGRYRSGKFDRDLLPEGHPLKTNKKD